MKKAFTAYCKGRITREELYRYQELHKLLLGEDSFIMVDDRPEWEEFNEICNKIHS